MCNTYKFKCFKIQIIIANCDAINLLEPNKTNKKLFKFSYLAPKIVN